MPFPKACLALCTRQNVHPENLQGLHALRLCLSTISFKMESLRTDLLIGQLLRPPLGWLVPRLYAFDMQIHKQMYDEITKFSVTTIIRMDAFLMAEKH